MRQSQYVFHTLREAPRDELAVNAQLLIRAGFVSKLQAGVYTFLPLGLRVLENIERIVRSEMNAVGGQELFMPALHPKEIWEKTGRWGSFDALLRLKSKADAEYALGATHEEVIYPLLTHYVASYKDLPVALYQIQTKFRDEARAKSGLLRGREFRMKDLYSFHETAADRDQYYHRVKAAYATVFKRLGLKALVTAASGGTFSAESLEFQVPAESGEDTIFICAQCNSATNKELVATDDGEVRCRECQGATTRVRAVEVGNIFPLKEKYATDFHLAFKDREGREQIVAAGCYGLGTTRVMGTVVEVSHDANGIIWPEAIAPFALHLIALDRGNGNALKKADELYEKLGQANAEALYDDRADASPGEKFADADLIGLPLRVVVSEKSLEAGGVEIKYRYQSSVQVITIEAFFTMLELKK